MDSKLKKSQLTLALMASLVVLPSTTAHAAEAAPVSLPDSNATSTHSENMVIGPTATDLPVETQVGVINPNNTVQSPAIEAESVIQQDAISDQTPGVLDVEKNMRQVAEVSVSETSSPQLSTVVTSEPVAAEEGDQVELTILSTTDLHTNLVNYDYYQDKPSQTLGLAKTAVLLEEERIDKNVFLVDNGDTIQGTPLGTYKAIVDPVELGEDHPMYAALEQLGYDAGTLGNHEFNYGLDYLKKVLAAVDFPIVNANVMDAQTGEHYFTPYSILTKTVKTADNKSVALKIGVTGIVPPQILVWDKAHLEGKVVVEDSVKAIERLVPQMREAGADVVVVLSHSGIGDEIYVVGEENVGYQLAAIDGVDAVVTGHSHAEFPSPDGTGFYDSLPNVNAEKGTIHGVPVTMAGKYGDHLGIIDLSLTYRNGKWQVTESKGRIRKIDTETEVANQDVISLAKEAHEGTIAYVRNQVGETTAPINSYFALVKDDPSVQIVNNAQIWYAEKELIGTPLEGLPILSAAAPFKAGTRGDATAYTDIPAGPIAIKNVADLYLYDNVTAVLKVTGAQVREWLEMSAGQFNQVDPNSSEPQALINTDFRTYNFDVIDGLTYSFDITQPNKYDRSGELVNPTASRVRDLTYQGEPVKDDQEFAVVTNNYRAFGNFPGVRDAALKLLLNLENRQVIINYILELKTINPSADNNWQFASTIKGLDLRFQTADKAKNLIDNMPDITYIDGQEGGFGNFRLEYSEPSQPNNPGQGKDGVPGYVPTRGNHSLLPSNNTRPVSISYASTYSKNWEEAAALQYQASNTGEPSPGLLPKTGTVGGWWWHLLGCFTLAGLTKHSLKRRQKQ